MLQFHITKLKQTKSAASKIQSKLQSKVVYLILKSLHSFCECQVSESFNLGPGIQLADWFQEQKGCEVRGRLIQSRRLSCVAYVTNQTDFIAFSSISTIKDGRFSFKSMLYSHSQYKRSRLILGPSFSGGNLFFLSLV